MLSKIAAISLGAAIGANGRYFLTYWVGTRWGSAFPLGTLLVNVIGSFLIGVAMVLALSRFEHNESFRLFWVTGILGGFTTFSAFSFETLALLESGRWQAGSAYVVLSFGCSLFGVVLGTILTREALG